MSDATTTQELPKNHYTVIVNVPEDTELPPRMRELLEELSAEMDKYPGAVHPERGCSINNQCGTQCASNSAAF